MPLVYLILHIFHLLQNKWIVDHHCLHEPYLIILYIIEIQEFIYTFLCVYIKKYRIQWNAIITFVKSISFFIWLFPLCINCYTHKRGFKIFCDLNDCSFLLKHFLFGVLKFLWTFNNKQLYFDWEEITQVNYYSTFKHLALKDFTTIINLKVWSKTVLINLNIGMF